MIDNLEKTYKIIGFDKNTGQLLIKWDFNDSITLIDLPIIDGHYITGDALDIFIKGYFNVESYTRMKNISSGVNNTEEIAKLISV